MDEVREWSAEEIREKVGTSRAWAERGLVAIANDGGFPIFNELLADFAEELISGRRKHLTPRQLAVAQKALSKYYVDRLVRIIQRKAGVGKVVRVEVVSPHLSLSSKAEMVVKASGVDLADFDDGKEFAKAVMERQGGPLLEIGWGQEELQEAFREIAGVAWGRIRAS